MGRQGVDIEHSCLTVGAAQLALLEPAHFLDIYDAIFPIEGYKNDSDQRTPGRLIFRVQSNLMDA